jgi:hypothetical protein
MYKLRYMMASATADILTGLVSFDVMSRNPGRAPIGFARDCQLDACDAFIRRLVDRVLV